MKINIKPKTTPTNLLNQLRSLGYEIPAPCAGNGTCGKCHLKILNPKVITEADKRHLSEKQLEEGYRLSCTYPVMEETNLFLETSKLEIISDVHLPDNTASLTGHACAIDIGTTSVVMSFMDCDKNKLLKTITFSNPQSSYGADVISRITYAENNLDILVKVIRRPISEAIQSFVLEYGTLNHIYVSGNTTMNQLFMGLSISSLGLYPFDFQLKDLEHIDIDDFTYTVIPGLSAFVGGDILSGIVECDFINTSDTSLLIDLGTNGEMALSHKSKIYTTSTAAGPVFEGISLSCGMQAKAGAIYDYDGNSHTIDKEEPKGICGTGTISTVAYLSKNGLIDATGRFIDKFQDEDKYYLTDNIYISQGDIRAIQTAKSAIRTGIEILLDTADIQAEDVKNIYISGGFGKYVSLKALCDIDILPSTFLDKTRTIGNSSLNGAIKLMYTNNKKVIEEIISRNQTVSLSDHPKFQDYFMDYMYF
ncbi:ASKHA domain-containing protein [Acidaminobacter sp. JC074]|uniref:ASKHA domain-containing protein n=1 Tax=Acidaminobacter sp. JC074 TaxID=2530199 RepID=UPI001F0F0C26|nr:ASKHA domain-containing protein [Acidaminobacter sp. JC074]